jgi:Lrp/AsnC family transcriptional regulator for asnA, asnC and gidA
LKKEHLDLAERWKGLDPELLPVDATDIAILNMLIRNSRETYSDIAGALGITEATVRRRVRALVDKGLIIGFTTRINFGAVENTVKAFVHLQVAPDRLNDVISGIRAHPRVAAVHRVTGQRNLLLVALFVSIAELQDFVDNFLRMDGISDTEVQIVMVSHKEENWGGV